VVGCCEAPRHIYIQPEAMEQQVHHGYPWRAKTRSRNQQWSLHSRTIDQLAVLIEAFEAWPID
jgi:hypothetical protein